MVQIEIYCARNARTRYLYIYKFLTLHINYVHGIFLSRRDAHAHGSYIDNAYMQTHYVNTYYIQKYKKNKHIGTHSKHTHVGKQSAYHMAQIRREARSVPLQAVRVFENGIVAVHDDVCSPVLVIIGDITSNERQMHGATRDK